MDLNVGRIVSLIAIGIPDGRRLRQAAFTPQAGWLTFNAVALAFVALTNRAGYFRRGAANHDVASAPGSHAAGVLLIPPLPRSPPLWPSSAPP